jgi:hypothetical protein
MTTKPESPDSGATCPLCFKTDGPCNSKTCPFPRTVGGAVAWRRQFARVDPTGTYEAYAFRATPPGDEPNWEPLYTRAQDVAGKGVEVACARIVMKAGKIEHIEYATDLVLPDGTHDVSLHTSAKPAQVGQKWPCSMDGLKPFSNSALVEEIERRVQTGKMTGYPIFNPAIGAVVPAQDGGV